MSARWRTGVLLLGFGGGTLGGMVLTNVPDLGETNADAIRFYGASSGPVRTFAALYLTLLAVTCLLAALSRLLTDVEAGAARVRIVCLSAGAGYATLSVAAATAFVTPTAVFKLDSSYHGPIDPEFARAMSSLGDGLLLVAAPLLLAICLAALSSAAASADVFPGWVRRATRGLAVCLLFGWTWFPLLLTVLWGFVVGGTLVVRRPAERALLPSTVTG